MGSPLRQVKATSDVLFALSYTRRRSLTSAAISRARLRPRGAHATALKALETLAGSIDQNHAENIEGLRKDLMSLRNNFNELMQEQKTLGFDDSSGLRKNLQVAGKVERISMRT